MLPEIPRLQSLEPLVAAFVGDAPEMRRTADARLHFSVALGVGLPLAGASFVWTNPHGRERCWVK
jgi:hypothetical protein